METTESDVGYPEEQPPEVDDTPAEGTPQRQERRRRRKNLTMTMARRPATRSRPDSRSARQLEREHREVVARRRAAAQRARHEALDQPRRPVHRRRADRGHAAPPRPTSPAARAPRSARRCRARARRRDAGRCCAPAAPGRARARAASPARRASRPHPYARRSTGSGCPPQDTVTRAGERARSTCAQAIVQKRPPGRVLVEHRLADPAQDRRRRAPPRRRRAQRVARQRGHRRRLRALAADVADHEVPLALGGREHVVEVAADLEPLRAPGDRPRPATRRGSRAGAAAAATSAAPARSRDAAR